VNCLQCGRHLWFCTVPSQKKKATEKRKYLFFGLAVKTTNTHLLMSTPLATPFTGNAGSVLPDGVVTGNRKRKQAFSLNDPDNIELARLATQAKIWSKIKPPTVH